MSNIETGGPAFPTEVWDAEGIPQHTEGMTLRDYFAAKAMQAFIRTAPHGTTFGTDFPETNMQYANASYAMADAMLQARES